MRFCQLTLRDDVLLGDFVLADVAAGDSFVTMFVGNVEGDRRELVRPTLEGASARAELARRASFPQGKQIVVPMGAVVWAEVAAEPVQGNGTE